MPFIDVPGAVPTDLNAFDNYQVYNCLDSAITAQLLPAMLPQLNANTASVYRREMELQSLCLEMSVGGFTTDQMFLATLGYELEKDAKRALSILHQFCDAVGARAINPRSSTDVPWFFYEHLGLPAVYEYDRKTKQRKVSGDVKALEKLRNNHPIAMPFVNAILWYRETTKMASVFARGLEPRTANLRCNFSPSGTETGRLSSQQNPYGRGTNAQNLTDRVRQVVCAPAGYCYVNFDLKTAESLAVGYISRCQAYIDACLTGDVHTDVARRNWPKAGWTGDLKLDKARAEEPFYRMFSMRDLAKRGGHATNYFGKPPTLQKVAFAGMVEIKVVQAFQDSYLGNVDLGIKGAFPEIAEWHLETIARLQTDGLIVNALGRERRFWGRSDDSATHREAIAFNPQSLVADVMNEGLKQLQRWLLRNAPHILRLNWKHFGTGIVNAQVHDAAVLLLPVDEVHDLVPQMEQQLLYPVDFGAQGTMTIPFDASIGKRWNKFKDKDRWSRQGQQSYKPKMALDFLRD